MLRTTIRVLHYGGPENLGIRGSNVHKLTRKWEKGNMRGLQYIEKCCKSATTLKKTQTDIAKQGRPRRAGNPLIEYKYEIHKEGNIHKLTRNKYEHAEQL